MNIKEHIEAGHYPKDEKGRTLVPMSRNNKVFVVCGLDGPKHHPIIGFERETGGFEKANAFSADAQDWLLPPPPRKVKVTRYAVMSTNGNKPGQSPWFVGTISHNDRVPDAGDFYVELTGEYEEPWS